MSKSALQPLLDQDHQTHANGFHRDSEHTTEQQDEESGGSGEGLGPNLTPTSEGNGGVRGSTFIPAVLNLSKVILGSGMLVLPKCVQFLGGILGTLLLVAVAGLTFFTVHGLVYAAHKSGKNSYAATVRLCCGRSAKWGLLAAVFSNCFGMLIVFLLVFGDILVGQPPVYSGLIHDLLPGLPTSSPWLQREVVLLGLTVTLLVPLCLQRDLSRLSGVAVIGIGAVMCFSTVCIVLVSAAAIKGSIHSVPWLPDWDSLAALGGWPPATPSHCGNSSTAGMATEPFLHGSTNCSGQVQAETLLAAVHGQLSGSGVDASMGAGGGCGFSPAWSSWGYVGLGSGVMSSSLYSAPCTQPATSIGAVDSEVLSHAGSNGRSLVHWVTQAGHGRQYGRSQNRWGSALWSHTDGPDAPWWRHTAAVLLGVSGIVPILMNADVCHQAIFPAMHLLKPYSKRVFNYVVATALGLCTLVYVLVSLTSIATWGDTLSTNVLNNLSVAAMSPLIGRVAATVVALVVRLSYFVSIIGSFVFTLHPLRICTFEALLGSSFETRHPDKAARWFVPITLALLASIYLSATRVPGLWIVISLVGSASCTLMGFIFPSLVILVTEQRKKWRHATRRGLAGLTILLGLFLFVNGFSVLWAQSPQ